MEQLDIHLKISEVSDNDLPLSVSSLYVPVALACRNEETMSTLQLEQEELQQVHHLSLFCKFTCFIQALLLQTKKKNKTDKWYKERSPCP